MDGLRIDRVFVSRIEPENDAEQNGTEGTNPENSDGETKETGQNDEKGTPSA